MQMVAPTREFIRTILTKKFGLRQHRRKMKNFWGTQKFVHKLNKQQKELWKILE